MPISISRSVAIISDVCTVILSLFLQNMDPIQPTKLISVLSCRSSTNAVIYIKIEYNLNLNVKWGIDGGHKIK